MRTRNFRKYVRERNGKDKLASKLDKNVEEPWLQEVPYLAFEYATSFFVFDLVSVVPALISRVTHPSIQICKFFRTFRLGRVAN